MILNEKYSPAHLFFITFAALILLYSYLGIPKPVIADAFSYLLGADTFLHARLANPPHSLPQFFENEHIILTPSYASKFPPGQAIMLAIGQKLFHQPFYGILLALALFTSCFYWLLTAIIPKFYALNLSAFTCLILALTSCWVTKPYLPGALPAAGAGLILGAYLHSYQQNRFTKPLQFILGCLILSITRPYEGLIFTALITALFFYEIYRNNFTASLKPFLATLFISFILTFTINASYNFATTGNIFTSPNLIHITQYMHAPYLWFMPEHHPQIIPSINLLAHFYSTWELQAYNDIHQRSFIAKIIYLISRILISNNCLFPITTAILIFALRDANTNKLSKRFLFLFCGSLLSSSLIVWSEEYYYFAAILISLTSCYYFFWNITLAISSFQKQQALLLIIALATIPIVIMTLAIKTALVDRTQNLSTTTTFEIKQQLMNDLKKQAPYNLIFVHYPNYENDKFQNYGNTAFYDASLAFVYNGADIDNQTTIFAHDLGADKNQSLINYYALLKQNRKLWLLDLSKISTVSDTKHPLITLTAY